MGFEQRFLHHVRRIEFGLQAGVERARAQQTQVIAEPVQVESVGRHALPISSRHRRGGATCGCAGDFLVKGGRSSETFSRDLLRGCRASRLQTRCGRRPAPGRGGSRLNLSAPV